VAMPWQLREGKRRRVKGAPPRPIAEQLPAISVNDLPIPHYWDDKTYILNLGLRFTSVAAIKVARDQVEICLPSLHRGRPGPSQVFRLKAIKTGFGIRHAFICTDCGRPVIKVYQLNRHLACMRCHNARRASDALNQQQRPVLQAARIQSFLDNKPRLFRKTHERLLKRLGQKVMLAQSRMGTKARPILD
jgi:hypothetical protein